MGGRRFGFFNDPVGLNTCVSVCGVRHMGCLAKHAYHIMVPSLYMVLGLDVFFWLPARPLQKRMGILILKPWRLHFIFWGAGKSKDLKDWGQLQTTGFWCPVCCRLRASAGVIIVTPLGKLARKRSPKKHGESNIGHQPSVQRAGNNTETLAV